MGRHGRTCSLFLESRLSLVCVTVFLDVVFTMYRNIMHIITFLVIFAVT